MCVYVNTFLVGLNSSLGVMFVSYCLTSGGVCCPLVPTSVVVKLIGEFGCCQPELSLEKCPVVFLPSLLSGH